MHELVATSGTMTALRRPSIKGKWQRSSTGEHLGSQVWFGNRDDTTCLIHDFYLEARPVGGGWARRGHYARGIVATLDPTAPCPHRDFAGEGVVLWTRLRPVHGKEPKRLIGVSGLVCCVRELDKNGHRNGYLPFA